MKVHNLFMSLILTLLFSGCSQQDETGTSAKATVHGKGKEIVVSLQPYHSFPKEQLLRLQTDMQHCLDTLVPEKKFKVEVLDEKTLPQSCYYKPRNRYRADSIIRYQKTFQSPHYIMGVTSKDVSTSVHGHEDFGILGLSYRPGKSAVVSTFRVKNKPLFYKVAVHEFLHCLGLPHCAQNDRSCYICDANKVPQLEKQYRLCPECKKKLLKCKSMK